MDLFSMHSVGISLCILRYDFKHPNFVQQGPPPLWDQQPAKGPNPEPHQASAKDQLLNLSTGSTFLELDMSREFGRGTLMKPPFFGIPSPGSSFARRHPSWKLGHSMNRSGNFMKAMGDFQCRLLCTSHSEKDAPETLMPVPVLSDGCKHQVPHYHPKA